MKQTFVAWLCVLALGLNHCHPNDTHVPERLVNASIAAQHQAALDSCFDDMIATVQTTGDEDRAMAEFDACADKADKTYGVK